MRVPRALCTFHSSAFLRLAPSTNSPQVLRMRAASTRQISRRYFSEQQANIPSSSIEGHDRNGHSAEEKPEQPKMSDAEPDAGGKLQAKEQEVVDLTGRLRYLQADYLNLQRNAAREKEQTRDFAISKFASDLLETVDVLSMALKSVPPSALFTTNKDLAQQIEQPVEQPDAAGENQPSEASSKKSAQEYLNQLYTGVEMTHRLLLQTLFKYNVKPFDPTGDIFDPNRHEALYQVPMPGKAAGTIIDCQKVGYTIKDRTLRAAQVGVASESAS